MLGIAQYFWRLLPANPILLRVVQMNGKRRRDLFIRCGYLGLLVAVVIFNLISGNASTGNLSELAKSSANLFQILSYCQLALVALLAPIFTAGAITAEKDSQTYDILLATPLSNGQIVLGSLMSRLFFVIALLISGIPIFSITQIFGGVAIVAIVQSFLIAAATAIVTGAVAMAIAVLKVGTRRTIFSFYLFIVIYMVGTFMLDQSSYVKIHIFDPVQNGFVASKTSWLTGLNPFLALRTIFHDKNYMPPALGDLPRELQRWPIGWFLSNPANFYVTFMFFISFVLISPSILMLRRLAQSTTSFKTIIFQKLHISAGDRTRKPRSVWSNPIAWREACTKASAARASFLRYGFMLLGLGGATTLVVLFAMHERAPFNQYIDSTSYNPTNNQLTIYNADGTALPLPVAEDFSGTFTDRQGLYGKPTDQTALGNKETELSAILDLVAHTASGRLSVDATPLTVDKDGRKESMGWTKVDAYVIPRRISADDARTALLGAAIVEFAVILLIVTNAAASTVTREKEDGTLDLLLSTPITSRYYIWGKLRGLVSLVLPLLMVPVASAGIVVAYDLFRRASHWDDPNFNWIVLPEAVLLLPAMLIIVVAFASILGMNMSLRLRKTVVAVMSSVGIVVGACAAMGWCGYTMLNSHNTGPVGLGAAAFSPFTLMTVLINPYAYSNGADLWSDDNAIGSRIAICVLTCVAVGGYTAIVWAMYKSMVKNFDMTIRKQSR